MGGLTPRKNNPETKTETETKPANERTRHMLIWQASSVILRAMIFTCIQLFFVFKCVGVKEHRKFCFWLIVIYTMIFDSANYTIEILPLYQTSSMLQAAHMMIHAVNTFILFTIVGVFGNGYLPRNYLLAEIYYDLLSTVPIMPMFIVAEILFSSDCMYCRRRLWNAVKTSRMMTITVDRISAQLQSNVAVLK